MDRESNISAEWCPSDYIYNPAPYNYTANEDKPLASNPYDAKSDSIQIRPQRVHLTLRSGQEYNLTFQYSPAEDYPVDLYYLMDLSASMADDRDALSQLGDDLAKKMKNITRNFRLGFGSFVDKVAMPFTSIVPEK